LEVETENWKAWLGKGKEAVLLTTLTDSRFPEIMNDFRMAIKYSPVSLPRSGRHEEKLVELRDYQEKKNG
jgi:hypothetical protein